MSPLFKNEVCKETCIVIDHNSQFLKNSGSKLEFDPTQKNRSAQTFFSSLHKTTWTCIVEGVSEYCRIVYDVFPPSHKVSIFFCIFEVYIYIYQCWNIKGFISTCPIRASSYDFSLPNIILACPNFLFKKILMYLDVLLF